MKLFRYECESHCSGAEYLDGSDIELQEITIHCNKSLLLVSNGRICTTSEI